MACRKENAFLSMMISNKNITRATSLFYPAFLLYYLSFIAIQRMIDFPAGIEYRPGIKPSSRPIGINL
jgi:hypothetical protein